MRLDRRLSLKSRPPSLRDLVQILGAGGPVLGTFCPALV